MSELDPDDLDMTSVRSHLAELNKAGQGALVGRAQAVGAADVRRSTSAARSIIEHDPTAMAVAPKRDQTIPTHLSEPEIERLIETPNTGDALGRRDRAILELFYASGPPLERAGRRSISRI